MSHMLLHGAMSVHDVTDKAIRPTNGRYSFAVTRSPHSPFAKQLPPARHGITINRTAWYVGFARRRVPSRYR